MPVYTTEQTFPRPIEEVFAFFAKPQNLIDAAPPELNLKIRSGPEVMSLGAVLTVTGKRMGVPHQMVTEVIEFQSPTLIVDEMREGVFQKWHHRYQFEEGEQGTKLIETIEFEPPGGMMGLIVNAKFIERDLERLDVHRREKLAEILGKVDES